MIVLSIDLNYVLNNIFRYRVSLPVEYVITRLGFSSSSASQDWADFSSHMGLIFTDNNRDKLDCKESMKCLPLQPKPASWVGSRLRHRCIKFIFCLLENVRNMDSFVIRNLKNVGWWIFMKHSVDIHVLRRNSSNVDDDNDDDIFKPKHLEDCNARRLTLGLPVERKKERKKIREISEILRSPDQSTVSVKIAGESGPTFASYLGCSFPKVEMSPVCSFSSAIGWTKYRWGFKFLSSELGSLYYTVRSFSSNPIRLLLIDPSEILASLLLPRSDWEFKI